MDPGTGVGTDDSRRTSVEELVLQEIISVLPARLTVPELLLWLADAQDEPDQSAIHDAIRELKRSGLIRLNGDVLEPTLITIRAADLLTGPLGA
jgi:hypothetical protein